MLPQGGEVVEKTAVMAARYRIDATRPTSAASRPDLDGWLAFVRCAEEAGIDSVLISLSRYEPDPLLVSGALGRLTEKLKFIVAYRSGLMQPAPFVQQMNTLSALTGGRIALNLVAGSSVDEQHGYGDFLAHDERYARAEEFLAVCRAFWDSEGSIDFDGRYYKVKGGRLNTRFLAPDRKAPEIYVSGHSKAAEQLAFNQGSCLLRVAGAPEKLEPLVERCLEHGVEVCLRMCVLCRSTREEAVRVAESLLPAEDGSLLEPSAPVNDDSQMHREAPQVADEASWLTRSLWTGLVPYRSPVWTTLLGTPEEIAEALVEYKRIGVSQFIMSGWPECDEVTIFGRDVVPLVRKAEAS